MLLPELKQLAGTLGIKGTGALRKGQLIEAIKAAQAGGSTGGPDRRRASRPWTRGPPRRRAAKADAPAKRERRQPPDPCRGREGRRPERRRGR